MQLHPRMSDLAESVEEPDGRSRRRSRLPELRPGPGPHQARRAAPRGHQAVELEESRDVIIR